MKKIIFLIILLFGVNFPSVTEALILGPYTGQVIDSQTGEPVEGASALFYWVKVVPYLMGTDHEVIAVRLVYTDKDGKYSIPLFFENLGLTSFFESIRLVVYEPGYQAYIIRVEYPTPFNSPNTRPDLSFKEKNNIIKLDRIPPNFSHKEHYRKIEDALSGIKDYTYSYPPESAVWVTWNKIIETKLKALLKDELLSRAEWEKNKRRTGG